MKDNRRIGFSFGTLMTLHVLLTGVLYFRPDTLDPALLRPGRLDRKVEFGLPDLESRTQIFKIHTRTMNCERDIRFELLARLCPNSTGEDQVAVVSSEQIADHNQFFVFNFVDPVQIIT